MLLAEADQLRLPCEPAAAEMVAVQVQLLPLVGQFVPAVKLDGLTVNVGGVPQYQGTEAEFDPVTEKSRIALAGQFVFGTAIVTRVDWPG